SPSLAAVFGANVVFHFPASSHVSPIVLASCRGSPGLLGTVLLCASSPKSRDAKRVGKRDVVPVLICRSLNAIRSTRTWLRSFGRISLMLGQGSIPCPSVLIGFLQSLFHGRGFFSWSLPPLLNAAKR